MQNPKTVRKGKMGERRRAPPRRTQEVQGIAAAREGLCVEVWCRPTITNHERPARERKRRRRGRAEDPEDSTHETSCAHARLHTVWQSYSQNPSEEIDSAKPCAHARLQGVVGGKKFLLPFSSPCKLSCCVTKNLPEPNGLSSKSGYFVYS